MRAYVIKDYNGCYLIDKQQNLYSNNLIRAELFTDYELPLCHCCSDCKVVKITIAEGDLEKENIILKNALEYLAKEYTKLYCEHYCKIKTCGQCENGDYNFVIDNCIQQAKEQRDED